MSRSERSLIALAPPPVTPMVTPPVPSRRPRDPRVDAFRGIALVMILINHIPGNPYEGLTIRNFGFSDAAESFFVLSGIAAGLAYAGRFTPQVQARDGLWAAVSPLWARAWTLYLVHLFLTLGAIAIFTAGALWLGLDQMLTKINIARLFDDTEAALIGLPLLTHQLGYVNILPAYSALLLVAPLMIWLGLRRPWLLALLSAGLWLAAGIWRLNLPNYPNPGGWFFNPFAWQAVFVFGLLIGMALRRGERFVPRSRWLFGLALGFLLLVLAWRHVPGVGAFLNHQMARLGQMGAPFNLVSHDKTFLALPRLLHVLALVYVLSSLDWVRLATAHWLAAPLRLLGRQGLLAFSAGTLVALALQVVMAWFDGQVWPAWVLPPLGVALMLAAAALAEVASAPRRPRTAAPRPQAADPAPRLPPRVAAGSHA